jgi:hypothetical protein
VWRVGGSYAGGGTSTKTLKLTTHARSTRNENAKKADDAMNQEAESECRKRFISQETTRPAALSPSQITIFHCLLISSSFHACED